VPGQFEYRTVADLRAGLERLGLSLPTSTDLGSLSTPIPIGPKTVPNRLAIHPMEGFDSGQDGSPTDLVRRRYRRFGAGGAGLIWFEACAVLPEARSNPHQMMLSECNVGAFRGLVEQCRAAARAAMGPGHEPVLILQLTHSGRYSRPDGRPGPVVAHHVPSLDAHQGLPPQYPVVTDDELDRVQDAFVTAARLAADAGFDGVDVKACHGYLIAELLAAHTRRGSRYGGPSFEHRTRMLVQTHRRIAAEVPGFIATTRLNAFDVTPHPYGWGVTRDDPPEPDLSEPVRLVRALRDQGAPCINVTVGNPRYRPGLNRPSGAASDGSDPALEGCHRLLRLGGELRQSCPGVVVVGTGLSYFRHLVPQVAAGVVGAGWADIVGVGRMAFAYPDFARDLLQKGKIDPERVCVACGGCSRLLAAARPCGCVVRDREVYGPDPRRAHGDAEAEGVRNGGYDG
jgi:2,4-dienoyl-CoA reductase (NADPH2)